MKSCLDSPFGRSGHGASSLQRVCRESCNKGFGGVLLCSWACIAPFSVIEFENLKSSLCLPSVERSSSLNSVSTGNCKLCLDFSLRPLRAWGLLVAMVCKLFPFEDNVTRVLFAVILFCV
jgi:hypothetical protein